jgi:hypothetical protein
MHKEMLNIPDHKENAYKITLRFHLTPVKMAIVKITNNSKCWLGCNEIGSLIHG